MLNKVDFDDRALHRALVKTLEEGTFQVQGKEVELFARILIWLKKDVKEMIDNKGPKKPKEVITKL